MSMYEDFDTMEELTAALQRMYDNDELRPEDISVAFMTAEALAGVAGVKEIDEYMRDHGIEARGTLGPE